MLYILARKAHYARPSPVAGGLPSSLGEGSAKRRPPRCRFRNNDRFQHGQVVQGAHLHAASHARRRATHSRGNEQPGPPQSKHNWNCCWQIALQPDTQRLETRPGAARVVLKRMQHECIGPGHSADLANHPRCRPTGYYSARGCCKLQRLRYSGKNVEICGRA